ncbi:hypothetical protein U9M48_004054 [Paspalum notatum var. saurae]|uniref:Uncharacterized protein n=1 Tax=Paspalum notatum var. saurae TaxID=547442 RepID=A0AAQ3PKT8_PASNO
MYMLSTLSLLCSRQPTRHYQPLKTTPAAGAAMAAASAPLRLLSPSRSPWPPQDPSPRPGPPLHAWPARRRHLRAVRCASSPPPPSLDLPLLPFQPAEVLIPSEAKTLHLYEARYIALLEEIEYSNRRLGHPPWQALSSQSIPA